MNPNTSRPNSSAFETGPADEHRFLTPAEAAHRLAITTTELIRLRAAGKGPDWVLINRTVRYSLADLHSWQKCSTERGR